MMCQDGDRGASLFSLYLSVFVAVLGFSLVAPIFPLYVTGLGASYTLLGIIISIYGAVQLISQIPAGRLSDRFGRRPFLLLGLSTFILMPLMYLEAKDAYSLIPIRLLGGIGASMVWPIAMALIVDRAAHGQRGRAMGWYNAAFFSALAVGPAIGGAAYDIIGPEAPFQLWAALSVASFILVALTVRDRQKTAVQKTERFEPERHVGLIEAGFMPTFIACCCVVMWTGIVGGFNVTLLPEFAGRLGFSTTQIGILYLAYGGANAISNIYFGRQADRGHRKVLVLSGCLLSTLSFLLLAGAEGSTEVLTALAALGLGSGISNPSAAAIIADVTSPERRGEIFGIFNTARMSGVVVGPLAAGIAADAYGMSGALRAFVAIASVISLTSIMVKDPNRNGFGHTDDNDGAADRNA